MLPAAWQALKPYDGVTWQLAELAIREGDVLPPNLTELVLDADFRSMRGALTGALARPTVEPLMPLKNLQVRFQKQRHLPVATWVAESQRIQYRVVRHDGSLAWPVGLERRSSR